MSDTLILIAVRTDREDIGVPVQGILAALATPNTPNAHVRAISLDSITESEAESAAALLTGGNPDAFQTLLGVELQPDPPTP